MKKVVYIFVICLLCTLSITAQNLYIYKTDGTVYGKQTSTIDSINFSKAQDSFYVHHIDTIKRYAVSDVDSLSFTTPTNTTDVGVVINGVKWATRNVAAPGTFATSVEDVGMFYQWNSKVGWPATGDIERITATDGSTSWNIYWAGGYTTPTISDTWIFSSDPSPAGWRVPTYAEMQTLLDTAKVVISKCIFKNGAYGKTFTDKTTHNSIFLPNSDCRLGSTGSIYEVTMYWSSTGEYDDFFASNLHFYCGSMPWSSHSTRAFGCSVRPVAK